VSYRLYLNKSPHIVNLKRAQVYFLVLVLKSSCMNLVFLELYVNKVLRNTSKKAVLCATPTKFSTSRRRRITLPQLNWLFEFCICMSFHGNGV
jgi:hypothetical protein